MLGFGLEGFNGCGVFMWVGKFKKEGCRVRNQELRFWEFRVIRLKVGRLITTRVQITRYKYICSCII